MCLPQPPYVFTDPGEVEEAYKLAMALYYPASLWRCFSEFYPVLFKFAAEGRDVGELLLQLRRLLKAWGRLCNPRCRKDFCSWKLCSVKFSQLVKAAEEEGGVDLDFARAVYQRGLSAWCTSFNTYSLQLLDEAAACKFPNYLERVYQGDVYIHLATWELLERRVREFDDSPSPDICNRLSTPSGVVILSAGDGVEVFTKQWDVALFLWLAFDGVLKLEGRWCGYKVAFSGDGANRFAKAMLNLCTYLRATVKPPPPPEEYQEVVRRRDEAREECEKQLLIEPCKKAWKIALDLELFPRPRDKIAELERRLKEAEEECVKNGGSLDPCRRKLQLDGRATAIELNIRDWEEATLHCQLAESLRHLAEKAEPPLISEHLRQYWQVAAARQGHVLYYVKSTIEVLETGYDLYWPLIWPHKRE